MPELASLLRNNRIILKQPFISRMRLFEPVFIQNIILTLKLNNTFPQQLFNDFMHSLIRKRVVRFFLYSLVNLFHAQRPFFAENLDYCVFCACAFSESWLHKNTLCSKILKFVVNGFVSFLLFFIEMGQYFTAEAVCQFHVFCKINYCVGFCLEQKMQKHF